MTEETLKVNHINCFDISVSITFNLSDIIPQSHCLHSTKTIYNLRKVVLIKPTCPCEENMESWWSTKIDKYLDLETIIESSGWNVELFEVKVGARGYCSKSVLCYFKKLGFSNTLIKSTIKKWSKSCMECLFCIWLARKNEDWTPSAANCNLNNPSKESYNSPSSLPSLKQTIKPVSNAK